MNQEETFNLIEKTIKEVSGTHDINRLIQDCADKLSLDFNEVKQILIDFNSELLK